MRHCLNAFETRAYTLHCATTMHAMHALCKRVGSVTHACVCLCKAAQSQARGTDIDPSFASAAPHSWRAQENPMTRSAATLNELIQIARDGQTFYTDAVG